MKLNKGFGLKQKKSKCAFTQMLSGNLVFLILGLFFERQTHNLQQRY